MAACNDNDVNDVTAPHVLHVATDRISEVLPVCFLSFYFILQFVHYYLMALRFAYDRTMMPIF